jgi:hypothetical protein
MLETQPGPDVEMYASEIDNHEVRALLLRLHGYPVLLVLQDIDSRPKASYPWPT